MNICLYKNVSKHIAMTERHHLLSWTAHATPLVCTATLCSATFSLVGVLYCQALELFRSALTHVHSRKTAHGYFKMKTGIPKD